MVLKKEGGRGRRPSDGEGSKRLQGVSPKVVIFLQPLLRIFKLLTSKNLKKEICLLFPQTFSWSRKKKQLVIETLKRSGLSLAIAISLSRSLLESRPLQNAFGSFSSHGRSILPCTDSMSRLTLQFVTGLCGLLCRNGIQYISKLQYDGLFGYKIKAKVQWNIYGEIKFTIYFRKEYY